MLCAANGGCALCAMKEVRAQAIANWGHGGLCLRKEIYLFEKLLFAIQERNLELFYFLSF